MTALVVRRKQCIGTPSGSRLKRPHADSTTASAARYCQERDSKSCGGGRRSSPVPTRAAFTSASATAPRNAGGKRGVSDMCHARACDGGDSTENLAKHKVRSLYYLLAHGSESRYFHNTDPHLDAASVAQHRGAGGGGDVQRSSAAPVSRGVVSARLQQRNHHRQVAVLRCGMQCR